MKSLIVTALIGISIVATGTVAAQADTFTVHGYLGTQYGK